MEVFEFALVFEFWNKFCRCATSDCDIRPASSGPLSKARVIGSGSFSRSVGWSPHGLPVCRCHHRHDDSRAADDGTLQSDISYFCSGKSVVPVSEAEKGEARPLSSSLPLTRLFILSESESRSSSTREPASRRESWPSCSRKVRECCPSSLRRTDVDVLRPFSFPFLSHHERPRELCTIVEGDRRFDETFGGFAADGSRDPSSYSPWIPLYSVSRDFIYPSWAIYLFRFI